MCIRDSLIAPQYAHSNLDIPSLPAEMYSMFSLPGKVIIDAGGDDAGAAALGRFSSMIKDSGDYQMFYLINKYRSLTPDAKSTVEILNELSLIHIFINISRIKENYHDI